MPQGWQTPRVRVIVASFPTEASATDYREALRTGFQVDGRAVAAATVAAYGEPYHGHSLVAAWVRREIEPDVCQLAERYGGLLHDQSGSVVRPGWVRDFIAAREEAPDAVADAGTPPPPDGSPAPSGPPSP
jgi:hypothetical protein